MYFAIKIFTGVAGMRMPQLLFSKLIRAAVEFKMFDAGDRIVIGISGGKDSLFLAYALTVLRDRIKKNISLTALTIDPLFDSNFNVDRIKKFCDELGLEHEIKRVDIKGAIDSSKRSPCFTCSYFRRAAVNSYALEAGANKVAYAHHLDDAVETFLMSLLSSGQLTTFLPKTFLDRTGLTVIRPLSYIREHEIEEFMSANGIETVKSPCPIDGSTNRQSIKELIRRLEPEYPDLFAHLSSGMRLSSIGELWAAPQSRSEMREEYFATIAHKTVERVLKK